MCPSASTSTTRSPARYYVHAVASAATLDERLEILSASAVRERGVERSQVDTISFMVRTPKAQVDATAAHGGHGDSSVHHVVQHLRRGIIQRRIPARHEAPPEGNRRAVRHQLHPGARGVEDPRIRRFRSLPRQPGRVADGRCRSPTSKICTSCESSWRARPFAADALAPHATPRVAWRCPRQDPHRQPAPAGREGRCAEPRLPLPHLPSYQLATAAEDDRATGVARRAVPAHVGGVRHDAADERGSARSSTCSLPATDSAAADAMRDSSDVDRQPPPNRILERRTC